MPAAAPCSTRATIRTFSSGAMPPSTEPSVNSASAARMLPRWPNARSAQSVSSMVAVMAARKPVDSHCASTWLMPNAPMTSGIATLTMVADRITAIAAISAVTVASQR